MSHSSKAPSSKAKTTGKAASVSCDASKPTAPATAPEVKKQACNEIRHDVHAQFFGHPDFTQRRKPGTQISLRVMIDILRESPIARGPLTGLKPDHVSHHCNEIEKEHGHSRGDYQALILSVLWKFARKRLSKECKLGGLVNPVRERERTYKAKPRKAWLLAVQRAFYEGAREHLQLAFALLLYTGQRRGDVCRMRWTDIEDVKGGEQGLAVVQEKTGETVPVLLHSVLRRAIMRHARERKSEFILATPTGKRYDKGWLTKVIQARLVEIGQPKSKYTLHGLRKAAAVLLAESGATVEQLMSVMSWKTPTQAIYYCREANKKTLNRAAWAFLDKEAA